MNELSTPQMPRPEISLDKNISTQLEDTKVGSKIKGSFDYEVIEKNEKSIVIAIKNLIIKGIASTRRL